VRLRNGWYPLTVRSGYLGCASAMADSCPGSAAQVVMPTYRALAKTPDGLAFAATSSPRADPVCIRSRSRLWKPPGGQTQGRRRRKPHAQPKIDCGGGSGVGRSKRFRWGRYCRQFAVTIGGSGSEFVLGLDWADFSHQCRKGALHSIVGASGVGLKEFPLPSRRTLIFCPDTRFWSPSVHGNWERSDLSPGMGEGMANFRVQGEPTPLNLDLDFAGTTGGLR